MHPDVVHKFVFRFESEASSGTSTPITRVIRLFRTANVFLSDVHDYVRHLREYFHAVCLVGNWHAELVEIYTWCDPVATVALAFDVASRLLGFFGRLSAGGNRVCRGSWTLGLDRLACRLVALLDLDGKMARGRLVL